MLSSLLEFPPNHTPTSLEASVTVADIGKSDKSPISVANPCVSVGRRNHVRKIWGEFCTLKSIKRAKLNIITRAVWMAISNHFFIATKDVVSIGLSGHFKCWFSQELLLLDKTRQMAGCGCQNLAICANTSKRKYTCWIRSTVKHWFLRSFTFPFLFLSDTCA